MHLLLGATNGELLLDGTSLELTALAESTTIVILIIVLLLGLPVLLGLSLDFVPISVHLIYLFFSSDYFIIITF